MSKKPIFVLKCNSCGIEILYNNYIEAVTEGWVISWWGVHGKDFCWYCLQSVYDHYGGVDTEKILNQLLK